MTRSPLVLAALASAAVPGLDPVAVEGVRARPSGSFDVAFVTDKQERRWVIKAPMTHGAGAELEAVAALGPLLGRRLELAMPLVRGTVPIPEGRAIVYLRLPGRPLDFAALPPGELAAGVGRALAHVHNIELAVFEEAGRPVYDAESHRRRQLSELDRAAATGHVPTNLLTRWEQRLEDISLWRFAPTTVHGSFLGDNVLASFDDDDHAEAGEVRGVLGWEESRVGDPADDFAELVRLASPAAVDDVLRAYARARVERPDGNLLARARLAAEMTPMRLLLRALAAGARHRVEDAAESLRELERRTTEEDERRAFEAQTTAQEAAAAAPIGPPEPNWDATQPHPAFPDLSQTQPVGDLQDPDHETRPDHETGRDHGQGGDEAIPGPSDQDGEGSPDQAEAAGQEEPAGRSVRNG
ncbi:phosphotransferase [Intrasporangium calvum]|uniref:Phosphotransferase n=1 Tax=Intrasporangium calvum TaxID=53358 RepID=A0ABT5GLL7_9MICO|nr:phosphotransferase [Intrasporangium calvum]MDC5698958.1 phosphotransferase [Intrasporangium calvum]